MTSMSYGAPDLWQEFVFKELRLTDTNVLSPFAAHYVTPSSSSIIVVTIVVVVVAAVVVV